MYALVLGYRVATLLPPGSSMTVLLGGSVPVRQVVHCKEHYELLKFGGAGPACQPDRKGHGTDVPVRHMQNARWRRCEIDIRVVVRYLYLL